MNHVIYALGFFDGVHVGHRALLSACCALARERGRLAGVVTFDAHPDTLVLGQTDQYPPGPGPDAPGGVCHGHGGEPAL